VEERRADERRAALDVRSVLPGDEQVA